jgi:uncharacterized protein involved in exopolysaccharide biosynthesis
MFEGDDSKGRRAGGSLLSGGAFDQRARRRYRDEPVSEDHAEASRKTEGGARPERADTSRYGVEPRDERWAAASAAPPEPSWRSLETSAAAHNAASNDDDWQPLVSGSGLLSALYRARYLISALTLLGGLAGAAYALTLPKHYYSVAELLVDPRDLKLVERELTPSNLPYDATLAIVESQMRIMMSRTVMTDVMDKLELADDPTFNGTQPIQGLGGFIRDLFDTDGDDSKAARETRTLEKLYQLVSLHRAEKSFVVNVVAGAEDPVRAADIANQVTDSYIAYQATLQSGTATQASDRLSARLEELADKVRESEGAVEQYKAQNDLLDAQGRLIGDDELVRINDQLSGAKASTIALNARAKSIAGLTADQIVSGNLPEQINSAVISGLRAQYADIKQQYDAAAVKLGPRHPTLITLNEQLQSARREVDAEIRRVNAAIQVDLKRAVQTEQDLAARLAQVKSRQSGSKSELVRLRELEREAAADRAIYEAYLLRARETGEQRNLNTANISIISRAVPPIESSGGKRKLVTIAGAVAGLATGLLLAALSALLRAFGGAPAAPRDLAARPSPPAPPYEPPPAPRPYTPPPPTQPPPSPSRGRSEELVPSTAEWYRRRYTSPPGGGPGRSGGGSAMRRAASFGKSLLAMASAQERNEAARAAPPREDWWPDDDPPPRRREPARDHKAPAEPAWSTANPAAMAPVAAAPVAVNVAPPYPGYYPAPVMPAMMQPVPAYAYTPQMAVMPAMQVQAQPAVQLAQPAAQTFPAPATNEREIADLRAMLDDMRKAVSGIAGSRQRRRA